MFVRRSLAASKQVAKKQLFNTQKAFKQNDFWENIEPVGLDAIKQLTIKFQQDPAQNKVLLGEGVYRDNNGKPQILRSVREAEKRVYEANLDHEYAAVNGVGAFCELTKKFAFGDNSSAIKEGRIATVQALSGTGALRLAASFLQKFLPPATAVYLPNPSWVNHTAIFKAAGMNDVRAYRYFKKETNGMDVEGCLEDIRNAPKRSVILLHACAHNPTGVDPTMDTWKKISQVCKEKEHIVFFDSAYQAFASGNADTDAQAFRMFVEDGHLPIVCQSYAKNFGLYGERVGAVNVVCQSKKEAEAVASQLAILIRSSYSNPPIYGARLVATVLGDPALKKMWEQDVLEMASRIRTMREGLVAKLVQAGSQRQWSHITDQIGMFAFSGLTTPQVNKLISDYHIYMTGDGRLSISGLNTHNLDVVAQAIHNVTK